MYDFACSLGEYCFNRESRCFDNTKFYHDIFHGFSHSCSPAYDSKFLSSVGGKNTSICEQFNSYLQCIKASAKYMSQVNFMFFAQYIIHIWDKSKKKSFKKKLLFATATICYCKDLFDNNYCIYFPGRKFCFTSDYYNPWITIALHKVSAWIYYAVLKFVLIPPVWVKTYPFSIC